MSVLQSGRQGGKSALSLLPILASLLLALTFSPPAHAVTTVSIDGHPDPVTLTVGDTVTIRFDVSKAGGSANIVWARDLTGAGKYDPAAPIFQLGALTDGGGGDTDLAPARVAWSFTVVPTMPAGRYVLQLQDTIDFSVVVSPAWTVVPKPQPQVIAGRVLMGPGSAAPGSPPPDAIVWAYSDLNTPVANANIRPDGSYMLPVPPGSYILFAEWLGNLRSQRQFITLAAGQPAGPVDHMLLVGQEVSGEETGLPKGELR